MENVNTITNTKTCPVCGSDMKRDKTDNVHNEYVGQYTCQNHDCSVSATIRN